MDNEDEEALVVGGSTGADGLRATPTAAGTRVEAGVGEKGRGLAKGVVGDNTEDLMGVMGKVGYVSNGEANEGAVSATDDDKVLTGEAKPESLLLELSCVAN